jgi:hypothetical protein
MSAHTKGPVKVSTNGTLLVMGPNGPIRHIAQTVWEGDPQGNIDMLYIAKAYNNYEATAAALKKYGDHFPECAVIQECGRAVKANCNCGFDAALALVQP